MDVEIFCNNNKYQCSELQEDIMETYHLSSRLLGNYHKQFMSELDVIYVGICSKLVQIIMVVAMICNNNKLTSELVQFRVSRS